MIAFLWGLATGGVLVGLWAYFSGIQPLEVERDRWKNEAGRFRDMADSPMRKRIEEADDESHDASHFQ